jgi:8-oxo-dGTP pyrophosphatase MutT (NUDIX family)
MTMADTHHAATVVLLRDGADGLETLMLRKNSRLAFGGMWVFPGGRIDDADRVVDADELAAAANAAVREAAEEAGLVVPSSALIPFSHWTPPLMAPKRFLTWFFLASAPDTAVVIDQGEIHDHAWMRPAVALSRRDAGEIELAPPTWVTLHWLAAHSTLAAASAAAAARDPERFFTRIASSNEGPVAVWTPDVAHESGDLDAPGPRHRLWMSANGWRYERG